MKKLAEQLQPAAVAQQLNRFYDVPLGFLGFLSPNWDSHAAGVFPLSCVSAAASYDVHQRERTD